MPDPTAPKPRTDAADHLKSVARLLFAERGIDGVTVRDIAEVAGQKNHAAVGYHFGSKDALVREIILDGAILIDRRRNEWLDERESRGGPRSVREVVDVLIYAGVDLAGDGAENGYSRFVVMLGMTHRQFFMDTLADRWNSGYLRCLEHLRRLMPAMPAALKNQRFVFMGAYLGSVLAAREAQLADTARDHPSWQSDTALAHFALTMTAMLECPADRL
ncbi:TetR family transcriptional regulator [Polymorphobacter glacialis]|uniref:TetR family transcriptional regulator n=1 Tax=Sandarakinorhabdus glacialis TaxID=1614636 RepID=A0A916ZK08_9SPHN|nr:TetR/AcrR family transcriptional regulator [Polymorphobacter glacialis]GGE00317.1 TetR family transcriptional regulator [Polymorphobacter glacialis]